VNEGNSISKKAYLYGFDTYPLVEIDNNRISKNIVGIGGIIAVDRNNNEYYTIKDHLGSTRVVMNDQAEIMATFEYDAYGKIISQNLSETMSYLFTGQELDEESGLFNYKARFYDPDLCRFLSPDPLHEFASPYSYCGGDPVNYTDPGGMLNYFIQCYNPDGSYDGYSFCDGSIIKGMNRSFSAFLTLPAGFMAGSEFAQGNYVDGTSIAVDTSVLFIVGLAFPASAWGIVGYTGTSFIYNQWFSPLVKDKLIKPNINDRP